jgi:hypothetical protein
VESRSGTELRQFAETRDKDYEALLGLLWAESKRSHAKSIQLWFCIQYVNHKTHHRSPSIMMGFFYGFMVGFSIFKGLVYNRI